MKTKWNLWMVLALVLGLVFAGPAQPVSAAAAEATGIATFTITSSLNPSRPYQAVTFTVSGAGTGADPDYPPFGYVTFYDNGVNISGCELQRINVDGSYNPVADIPAVCTTSTLTPGLHTITAQFNSLWPDGYGDETLTLEGGQMVNDPLPLTISPETLPDGTYGTHYSQPVTVTNSDGALCGSDCYWDFLQGSFPAGMYYFGDTGEIEGVPDVVGAFTFTVTAIDPVAGAFGSRTYTLNILKATPEVTIDEAGTRDGWLYISTYVSIPNSWTTPTGSVSFSLNGVPLEACSGANARPLFGGGFTYCNATLPPDLGPGAYPFRAEFNPDATSSPYYNSGSVEGTLAVPVQVTGLLFNDMDQNGVRDPEAEGPVSWGQVSLDQGCDGTVEQQTTTDYNVGQFAFDAPMGFTYCLSATAGYNDHQTTTLGEFTLEGNRYFEIGFYRVELIISPESLPTGSVGEPYSQTLTITGGEPPYTVTGSMSNLPDGLTFDEETFTLSGTPTAAGYGWLYVEVADSDGVTGVWQGSVIVPADGTFTFTSTPDPAASGQEVTFTFAGTGDVVDPDSGPLPPYGTVTFYDGDTPIAGCEGVLLNYDYDLGFVDVPAVCTTSALAVGPHEISAAFASSGIYRDTRLTLNQQVGLPADLRLTKVDRTDPIKPGAALTYTLVVSNLGTATADTVTLTDTLDPNTTFVKITKPKGWTCTPSAGVVTCTKAGMASGETATFSLIVLVKRTAAPGSELVNTAQVASLTYDPDLGNNTAVQKTLVKIAKK